MANIFLIFILLGFGVGLSTQNTDSDAEKCYIAEIDNFVSIDFCSEEDEVDNTVKHQGVCTAKDGKVYTCEHGQWSGTDSSVATLNRRKRFFWLIIPVVICGFFCRRRRGGGVRTITKYPPTFPVPCTPNDIQSNYNIGSGEDSVVVSWTVPRASDRNGGTPSVTQVGGGRNGGRFDGATYGKTHYITYKATDSDGLTGHCYFSFTITELTCNSPSWPPNGARTCDNKNILGSSCHYTCNTGYQLTGSSTVTCQNAASPSWSAVPTCEKITCSEPNFPVHTTAQCSDPDYGYLSVCSMKCDVGYTLKGAYFMQCQADRTWSNVGATSCVDDSPPTISCVTPQIFYADRSVTTTSVTWQLPTASDATDDNPTIVQTFGPTMGAVLEVGTEIVKYKAVDEDGSESQECFIQLQVEGRQCIFNYKLEQLNALWEIACPELEAPINGALIP
ncbi:CUB and sushi domain-containing protein 1-like [Ruditapes philippinarum]|uniref:CUB and sushi domain-containing protein 1-like n=1 Tax=Ruditapes philippinarum TaxID=129788 RepID=UPI00295C211D|nr:CUB and sushi domain-containing protein 1-like [Ruditapes philippinarum]